MYKKATFKGGFFRCIKNNDINNLMQKSICINVILSAQTFCKWTSPLLLLLFSNRFVTISTLRGKPYAKKIFMALNVLFSALNRELRRLCLLINRTQMTIDYYLRKAFAKLVNKIYPVA